MKRIRSVSLSLTLFVCVGLAPRAFAETGTSQRSTSRALDVVLHDGGMLVGQVVGTEGRGKATVPVSLRSGERELVRVATDDLGRFAVKGLPPGSYQLATNRGQIPVRAWTKSAAPPTAAPGALLVEGTTVRGQNTAAGPYHTRGVASFNQGSPASLPPAYNTYGAASFNQGGGPGGSNSVLVQPSPDPMYGSGETVVIDGVPVGDSPMYPADAYGASAGAGRPFGGFFRSPLGIATVAAAIAIPIALDDDDAS